MIHVNYIYTLSGRIGKVVASHAAVARSIPLRCTDLYCARGAQGVLPMRVGGATSQLDQPSLTPMSVAGWFLTATRSSPVGCFSALLKVVDN